MNLYDLTDPDSLPAEFKQWLRNFVGNQRISSKDGSVGITDPDGNVVDLSASTGGVVEIDSPGGTITVTNPTGPTVDLDVVPGSIELIDWNTNFVSAMGSGFPQYCGLGAGITFTPTRTGKIVVLFGLTWYDSVPSLANTSFQVVFGDGVTPPNQGDSAPGAFSVSYTTAVLLDRYRGGGHSQPLSLVGGAEGLTVGQQYWFDVRINTGGTIQFNVGGAVAEIG